MKIASIVVPVLAMLILGFLCGKLRILNPQGTSVIKKYITSIALPVTIFHSVATADYSKDILLVIGMMLAVTLIGFGVGFLCKGLIREPYRKYFPYVMTVYEGGMLAFPLYQNLCGAERMPNIAIIDMGVCVFSFGIYFSLLEMTDSGSPINGKNIIKNAFQSPPFLALLLGLLLGITGWLKDFMALPAGELYLSIKNMIVAPLSAMILLCVGSEFRLEKSRVGICLKTVLIRLLLQGVLLALVLWLAGKWKLDPYIKIGFAIYLTVTPSFCLTSFVKDEEANKYMATTISLYMIFTVAAYLVIASIAAMKGL